MTNDLFNTLKPFDEMTFLKLDERNIIKLAEILKKQTLIKGQLNIGESILQGQKGLFKPLKYSHQAFQLFGTNLSYIFSRTDGDLELSLQLYKNTKNHYRINCFSRCNDVIGQIFSINLTTKMNDRGLLFFTQKILLSETYPVPAAIAKDYRQRKREALIDTLLQLGYEITEHNDLLLGVYDPKTDSFLNTTAEKFISDFFTVSLLKGHYMGNKGYQLDFLPSYHLD